MIEKYKKIQKMLERYIYFRNIVRSGCWAFGGAYTLNVPVRVDRRSVLT